VLVYVQTHNYIYFVDFFDTDPMLVVKRCMIVTASDDLSDLLAKNIEAVTSVHLTRYVIVVVVVVAVTDGIRKRDCGHTIILRMSSVCSSSERMYDKFCEYVNF